MLLIFNTLNCVINIILCDYKNFMQSEMLYAQKTSTTLSTLSEKINIVRRNILNRLIQ